MKMGATSQKPDVVIVGAGPVGLVAACDLARRGIAVRIIDKLKQPTAESRAIAIHARSLDMFDRMGIVDDLIATGVKSTGMNMYASGKKMVRLPIEVVDSAYPYTLVTAQTETERILTAHLAALGVTVERGLELTELSQNEKAVHLVVRHADGGIDEIEASWVIGTDGGHSNVRRLVGTQLQGSFKGERFILGDVEVEPHFDNANMYTYFDPDGPVVTLPMLGGRVRFLAQIHDAPGTPLNQHPTQEQLQQIIDARIGGVTITAPHWLTCFEIHHGQVPAYRLGRVFLAGDAAHIHSPAGGQGMNTGIQDAFNLCWKLATVIKGDAGNALLDSYHAERHPIGKQVIDFTSTLTKLGTLKGPVRLLRDAIVRVVGHLPPAVRVMASNIAETNIAYKNSPITLPANPRHSKVSTGQHLPHITEPALQKQVSLAFGAGNLGHTVLTVAGDGPAPAPGPAGQTQVLITSEDTAADGYNVVVADPNGLIAKRYGLRDGGRVVVRPDGYIGAVIEPDDDNGVANYFEHIAR
jgi:2-polyprenyl-6-methoxyphenol hydroxylase-like FAD-dependent oxidoreductase